MSEQELTELQRQIARDLVGIWDGCGHDILTANEMYGDGDDGDDPDMSREEVISIVCDLYVGGGPISDSVEKLERSKLFSKMKPEERKPILEEAFPSRYQRWGL